MSSKIKSTLIACGGTMLVLLSFAGTIGASLSWFTYTKKAEVTYKGTSISSNKLLQVGIATNLDLTSENFICEGGVAWTLPGAGISPDQLDSYLSQTGYASTSLGPVTSKKYSEGDELSLYQSPYDFNPNNLSEATDESYVKIPLAFRIINLSDGDYVANRNIWITETSVSGGSNEGFDVGDGVRVHFDNDSTKFILNPSKDVKGYTQVAGLLDLNEDGYYDVWEENKEIVYGDFEGTPTYSEPLEEDSELDDFYKIGLTEPYTFLAAHQKGSRAVNNWDDLTLKKQEYFTLNEIAPGVDEDGMFQQGKPICNTGTGKIAYTTMTIWSEGWDLSVVDQISSLSFNLSITFEIDKV